MTVKTIERKPDKQTPVAELEMSYEEANIAELKNVLSEFAARRAGKKPEDVTQEDIQRTLDEMWQNYELLEDLGEERLDGETIPAFTVAIPVAVLGEKPETVANAIELIRHSHNAEDDPVEIVVWANAKYAPDTKHDVEIDAKERYDDLVKTLEPLNGDGVIIRAALQTLPRKKGRMSDVRSNYMKAIAMEGLEKGYGYDHPVTWLDADTTFIAKGALKKVTDQVRNFNAYTAHTNQNFTTEWTEDTPLGDMDDATKAVAVNEIMRRRARRNGARQGYYEESGLTCTLGVYLKVGGLNTDDPVNEAPWLVKRMMAVHEEELLKVMNMRALTPKSLWRDGQGVPPAFMRTVKSARTGLSGRRHHARVKQDGASALVNVDTDYISGGGLYSEMDTTTQFADKPIGADDMYAVLDKNRSKNDPFKGRLSEDFAQDIVTRYFSRHSRR